MVEYKNIHEQFRLAEEMDSLLIASGGRSLSGHVIICRYPDAPYSNVIDLLDVLKKDSIEDYSLISRDTN